MHPAGENGGINLQKLHFQVSAILERYRHPYTLAVAFINCFGDFRGVFGPVRGAKSRFLFMGVVKMVDFKPFLSNFEQISREKPTLSDKCHSGAVSTINLEPLPVR